MNLKVWLGRVLMGFTLLTIGVGIGRNIEARRAETRAEQREAGHGALAEAAVYAAHMTFRCFQCTQIELLARELLETEFAGELRRGEIEFSVVDYLQNKEFAARYDISASTVVVAGMKDGKETDFERLDRVWTKIGDKKEFFDYLRPAILSRLRTRR